MNDDEVAQHIENMERVDRILVNAQREWTIRRQAEDIASQLLEYAQLTGHSDITTGDIMDEFECGKLTAKAAYVIYNEIWKSREKALDRVEKVLE